VNWEYLIVEVGALSLSENLQLQLSALGSLGWEAVGYTNIEKLGPNTICVLLKREAPAFAAPSELEAGWNPDPSGRFELRHWDGQRWTQHVSTDGVTETDFPNVRVS